MKSMCTCVGKWISQSLRFGVGFAGVAAALLAAGCKSGETSPPPLTSAACSDPTAAVVITDPTNYALSDDFTMQVATLKDNTDLVFDWSKVTVDFFGKTVDPANDIDTVLVSLWKLSPQGIEQALKVDNLPLASNNGVITTFPDGTYTSTNLLSFNLLGQPLPVVQLWAYFNTATPDYQYPQDQYTFLAMAQSGADIGKNPRMISLFHVDPNATQTNLDFTNDSTKLAYSVDLVKAAPVLVPASTPALTIDWSQMTTNSIGNPYVYSQITQVAVAHYATKTLPQLQQDFLDLEDIADGWWSGAVQAGSTIDLSTLADKSGGAFPGIDARGVWMAALFCTNCNNPAPWSITILQPCK
jgi:hypothetical protein